MKLLDFLLAITVCALFLGNLARFFTGLFFFPFIHLALSLLIFYLCLQILFRRHSFGRPHASGPGPKNAARDLLMQERARLQGLALMMLGFTLVTIAVCLFNGVSLLLGVIYAVTLLEPFIFLCCAMLIKYAAQQSASAVPVTSLLFYRTFKYIMLASFVLGCIQAVLFGGFYDYVKGFFVGAGAGHHVFGGIMSALVIFLVMQVLRSDQVFSRRSFALLVATGAAMFMAMLTDTKQLLALALLVLVFWVLLRTFTVRASPLAKIGSLLTVVVIFLGGWLYLGQFFTSQYDKLVLGIIWKSNTLSDIWHYGRGDILNMLVGFGPGQTVSKLALMVSDYQGLFSTIGLDIPSSFITNTIWDMNQFYWVSNTVTGSSLFSQFFSWAGMLGDIGLIGLSSYIALIIVAYRVTRSSPTATLLWTYFVLIGFAFMWLEESPLPVTIALLAAIAVYLDDGTGRKQRPLPPP